MEEGVKGGDYEKYCFDGEGVYRKGVLPSIYFNM